MNEACQLKDLHPGYYFRVVDKRLDISEHQVFVCGGKIRQGNTVLIISYLLSETRLNWNDPEKFQEDCVVLQTYLSNATFEP